ncbi:MAG: glyoxalase/bleomycin resistance/dioxygenase family protein [Spirulina sp. SIO3F2]|nr:glyoxalase/bleomycin resistance/dioxygenase family protein [Spirulina sp. SIO3F2]
MTVRTHVALRVADLARSVNFYRAMFQTEPAKYKTDYAKFDLENPGLNLTLNLSDGEFARGTLSHLGIQVQTLEEVKTAIARFKAAGFEILEERENECCYALMDKVWVTDPDGNRWEVFALDIEDLTPEDNIKIDEAPPVAAAAGCCG